jgi:hypothetical protein
MPRTARVVAAGAAHHVTQRGNRQEQVFFSDKDRQHYLELLGSYSAGQRGDALLSDPSGPVERAGIADRAARLQERADAQDEERLRVSTKTGRPLGSIGFIERVERLTHCHLGPNKAGRCRRQAW